MVKSFDFHTSLVVQQWGLLDKLLHGVAGDLLLNGIGLDIPHVVYVAR